jgi:hypothetical protein
MAFPNSSITDIIATTLESRSKEIANNAEKNNALLAQLSKKGRIKPFTGGRVIFQEFNFGSNANGGSYSGYDTIPVGASDNISGAEFGIKQYAVSVSMSGLEMIQNSGDAQVIDLLEGRIEHAESDIANLISEGLYSDGTANGSKGITGLDAAVPADPTTGTYGGINRATAGNEFWRSQLKDSASSSTTIQALMTELWASCVRGSNHPDLIMMGTACWTDYMASLQAIQRFTDSGSANLGFPTVKFMGADVILDGGIGGYADTDDAYFLNTRYLHYRPAKERNMRALKARSAVNQDAEVTLLVWAGNLTCSGAQFQGRGKFD